MVCSSSCTPSSPAGGSVSPQAVVQSMGRRVTMEEIQACSQVLQVCLQEILVLRQNIQEMQRCIQGIPGMIKSAIDDALATFRTGQEAMNNQQATVEASNQSELTQVRAKFEKYEGLAAYTRRNNIRIIGISEETAIDTAAVAALLKDAFHLDQEPLLERAHRTTQLRPGHGARPRPVIARFIHNEDSVKILQQARELRQAEAGGMRIAVFPDYTPRVARARVAFNSVRNQLRGMEGVRYGLCYPARLRISYNGVQKEFVSADEAQAYVNTMSKG